MIQVNELVSPSGQKAPAMGEEEDSDAEAAAGIEPETSRLHL